MKKLVKVIRKGYEPEENDFQELEKGDEWKNLQGNVLW